MKPIIFGLVGTLTLLGLYWIIVGLISGREFAVAQFSSYWYFFISLAVGFGIQIGLYTYLKRLIADEKVSGRIVTVSGTTSTVAMLSCCAHYLVNILPVIATAGVISLIGQYQIELFWIGLAFNLAGIGYITKQIIKFRRP
ncbi:MAG: hypothetical protein HY481_01835 [Candidatus Vogelbacteria bacterium]|nr:hypothetical protein [Candidatus Vogelbacteria bacterium]